MLDVCDRLGILVWDEFTDMWDIGKLANDYHLYFPQWWQSDLTSMILRDRNHPSVFLWSIGNEISADPNSYGPRLSALVHSLDTTRPVSLGGMNVGPKGPAIRGNTSMSEIFTAAIRLPPTPRTRTRQSPRARTPHR